MSNFYGYQQHSSHHNVHQQHHSGRPSRRATRANAAHHNANHKHNRALRLQREAEELANQMSAAFRQTFDAARSFDFEDDEIFCPFNLLTDDDLQSIHSGSDRSSLSSGSPEHSPLQHQIQPTPSFLLPPSTLPSFQQPQQNQPKIHQPLAQRKGIPIIDPSTRAVASPPTAPSVSPARQLASAPHFIPAASRRGGW